MGLFCTHLARQPMCGWVRVTQRFFGLFAAFLAVCLSSFSFPQIANAQTTADCTVNGGAYDCSAPLFGLWTTQGGWTGCNEVSEFVPPETGNTPEAAVYAFAQAWTQAQDLINAGSCHTNYGPYVRTSDCSTGAQYWTYSSTVNPPLGPVNQYGVACSVTDESQGVIMEYVTPQQPIYCPSGTLLVGTGGYNGYPAAPYACWNQTSQKNIGCPYCNNAVGDPLDVVIGNLYEEQVDYSGGGRFPLEFHRYYNSYRLSDSTEIGLGWRTNFDRSIDVYAGTVTTGVHVHRPDGRILAYVLQGNGSITTDADITDTLQQLASGWRFTIARTSEVETYSASGQLLSITDRNGVTQTLSYDSSGRLSSVIDTFGRTLTFSYNSASQIATVTEPDSGVISYGYDSFGQLTSVTYPDLTMRSYHYTTGSGIPPGLLSAIVDESGTTYASFVSNSKVVTGSQLANGVAKISVTNAVLTDAFNTAYTYGSSTVAGMPRVGSIARSCSGCTTAYSSIGYDSNGNVSSRSDYNGNTTAYSYDLTRNLETSRTEAYGTSLGRTITTQWNPSYQLPSSITEPNLTTAYTYDSAGNRLTKTITDTTVTPNVWSCPGSVDGLSS